MTLTPSTHNSTPVVRRETAEARNGQPSLTLYPRQLDTAYLQSGAATRRLREGEGAPVERRGGDRIVQEEELSRA